VRCSGAQIVATQTRQVVAPTVAVNHAAPEVVVPLLRSTSLLLFLLGCRDDPAPAAPLPAALALAPVASGLSSPVFLTSPKDDPRLFILEQAGRIRIIENGTLLTTPFLDITSQVGSGGERGLLGLAFHPRFSTNGFFFVNYTGTDGHTRVARFTVSANRNVADAGSRKQIIQVNQPYANHNGGMIAFGPDGMLYIGMGDGGSGGDPENHAQTRSDLLGDMLRLNIDVGDPYTPAAGNPFLNTQNVLPEIWAWGLRNPWRFSFDRANGNLYIADVGQGAREEINVVSGTAAGLNYGWRIMEGTRCYGADNCNQSGLTLPLLDYDHSNGACSITGGYVYRGSAVPGIVGHYFYSDYCAGFLRSFRYSGGAAADQTNWGLDLGNVLSFGEDAAGELYVLTSDGRVRRIIEAS
jgi:glucose/arabinose dehydrogenase